MPRDGLFTARVKTNNDGEADKIIPITTRHRELLLMPSIASQLPIKFENGTKWEDITSNCPFCKKKLFLENIKGCVSRPTKHIAVIEAVGACMDCNVAIPYFFRLHDDFRITAPRHDGWKTWLPDRSLLGRLKNWITEQKKEKT